MNKIAILLATWFGVGLLPKAPGTWGSISAIPCAYLLVFLNGQLALTIAILIGVVVGIWASNCAAKEFGKPDHSRIVIDEVVGQWITLLFVPLDLSLYLVGFILFRLFDIYKPWPINIVDRRIKSGIGVMLDDIIAGIYAGTFLWIGHNYNWTVG